MASTSTAKSGDRMPCCQLDCGTPGEKVDISELAKGKKVVILGIPGAFTPVCSTKHVPGFLEKCEELKAKGISDLAVIAVNDCYVMKAWEKDLGGTGKMHFLADPRGDFAKSLGLLDDSLVEKLGNPRMKRFSMLVEDGVIKCIHVAGEGGATEEDTFADKLLGAL